MAGDITGHASASDADFSLAGILVYWTGGDAEQMERIMRRSLLGTLDADREKKWARRDYLSKLTIPNAINLHVSKGGDFYRPGGSTSLPQGKKVSSQEETFEPADSLLSLDKTLSEPASEARPRTDLGNSERLASRLQGKALYVYEAKCWYVFTGRRWEPDTTGAVYRHAQDTVRAIYAESENEPTEAERKATAKWAMTSESKTRIDAMVALSATIKGMTVSATVFDTDPYLLACNNGTLDLRTGELRDSKPEDYISKLAPVDWHGLDTFAPRWQKFLGEILPNEEIREFIQVAAGYGATRLSNARAFFICHGSGRNGKGTFLETLRDVLGDYGHTSKAETFLVARREGGQASTDVADLKGSRLVITSESRPGAKIDANLIKSLTGDDTINARHLFQRAIQFKPTWSVFLATNHRPEMPGDDIALWERVKLIPFDVRISDEQKDTDLKDKLMAEAPGILAWIVSGAKDYIERGLEDTSAIREATAEYQTESDPIGDFIARYLDVNPGNSRYYTTAADVRQAWLGYCDENDIMDINVRQVGMRLKSEHGKNLIVSKTTRIKGETGTPRVWFGFALNDHGEDIRLHGENIEMLRSAF
jgi:putative DNA primase/helicase